MSFFGEDCQYVSSSGADPYGVVYRGHDAIRDVLAAGLGEFPDGRYEATVFSVADDRGVLQWTYTGTSQETGERAVVRGCDLFVFDQGKIVVKDAFRKAQLSPS